MSPKPTPRFPRGFGSEDSGHKYSQELWRTPEHPLLPDPYRRSLRWGLMCSRCYDHDESCCSSQRPRLHQGEIAAKRIILKVDETAEPIWCLGKTFMKHLRIAVAVEPPVRDEVVETEEQVPDAREEDW
jgi:hypothetical protein